MANFTFDGTSSITATKNDTVLITADPTTFTQATDNGSSVTLAFGTQSVTITGTTLAAGNLPNVFVSGGTFSYSSATPNLNGSGTGNELAILSADGTAINSPAMTTATSKIAIFGGLGRVDTIDGNDQINIGGKGSFLVFGNAGNDSITQSVGVFDSTSTVNVSGDQGADTIDFSNTANAKASIFAGGGAGGDLITVVNSGATTIFGGVDATDGADTITFNAPGAASGTAFGLVSSVNIFGNGGGDNIFIGADSSGASANGVGLASGSTATVFGGSGDDSIYIRSTSATDTVIGGEGKDTITVVATGGNTFITGGNANGDQSQDSADLITVTGSKGTLAIFGNVGNDTVTANTLGDSTTISIYGGKDNDTIVQGNANQTGVLSTETGKNAIFIAGGENNDTITAAGNGGAVTIYGGISSSDATDGSDQINYGTVGATGSTGTANIFANAGNDTVTIGTLGNDSVNTVTVYGGGGSDSIAIGAQSISATAAATQQISVFGNEGADAFAVTVGRGQTVTIQDFTVSQNDTLQLKTGLLNSTLQVVSTSQTFQTIDAALQAAAGKAGTTAGSIGAVKFGNDTYVVINGDTNGAFSANNDQAIKLTGVTDPNTIVASVTTIV